jgi:hypothetical protein
MASLLLNAGDLEMQITLLEALYRYSHRLDRQALAQTWFSDASYSEAFMAIQESEFETVLIPTESPVAFIITLVSSGWTEVSLFHQQMLHWNKS